MYEHPLSKGLRVCTTCVLVLLIPISIPAWYFGYLPTGALLLGALLGLGGLIVVTTFTFAVTSGTANMWRGLRRGVKEWAILTIPSVLLIIGLHVWLPGDLVSANSHTALIYILSIVVSLMGVTFFRYLRWSPGKQFPAPLTN